MRSRLIKDVAAAHKLLTCPFELKDLNETGTFTGYGSIFGNVDLGGDVVERGAFKEFVTTKDNKIRILYQHDTRQPIGKASITQDMKGLYLDGSLVLEMGMARNAYAGMKAGILDGMSIGYDILPNGSKEADGVRQLIALKLWEVSIVTFGMNPLAKIETVKAANGITTKRQFEEFLRDSGFAKAHAVALASRGWSEEHGEQGDPAPKAPTAEEAKAIEDMKQFLDGLKG